MNEAQIRHALSTLGDAINADDGSWLSATIFKPIEGRKLVVHLRGGQSVSEVVAVTLNSIPQCASVATSDLGLTVIAWVELAAFGLLPAA